MNPPPWQNLGDFILTRIKALERKDSNEISASAGSHQSKRKSQVAVWKSSPTPIKFSTHTTNKTVSTCTYCQGEHYIAFCDKFRAISLDNRNQLVSEMRLCYNFLGMHSQEAHQGCETWIFLLL